MHQCTSFRDRLPGNEIDKYAIVLKREELARRALATDADGDLEIRKLHAAARAGKLTARDRWYRCSSLSRRLKRARTEDENIIKAQISDIWAEVCNGEWRVVYYDRETGQPVDLPDAHLFSPPPLLSVLANQLGRVEDGHAKFEDVMLERVREHVEEPAEKAPTAVQVKPDCLDPGNRTNGGAAVQQEAEEAPVEEAPAAVAATQGKTQRKNKGGRPPFDYKEKVINETVEWLEDEGTQPQSATIKYMRKCIAKIDRDAGPCDSTMKNWEREASARFLRQRETIGTNTS